MRPTVKFAWHPDFSVGVESVDAQHKGLFNLVFELECALGADQGSEVIDAIIDRLFAYVQVHFAHEEELMQAANYPKFEAHRHEHDDFTRKVLALKEQRDSGDKMVAIRLTTFLKSWYMSHIGQVEAASR